MNASREAARRLSPVELQHWSSRSLSQYCAIVLPLDSGRFAVAEVDGSGVRAVEEADLVPHLRAFLAREDDYLPALERARAERALDPLMQGDLKI